MVAAAQLWSTFADGVPGRLRSERRWLLWRYGDRRAGGRQPKVPLSARTGRACDPTRPRHWFPFAEALAAGGRLGADGVGYALSAGDGVVAADLDGVVDPIGGGIAD